jgi:hypothetical protein
MGGSCFEGGGGIVDFLCGNDAGVATDLRL